MGGLLIAIGLGAGLGAAPIKHDFVAIDEGLVKLLRVSETNPGRNWSVPVGRTAPRDMQLVGGGRILIGHDAGYTEFDLATGRMVRELARFTGVTSVRRLASGHTLVGGVNLDGSAGVVVLELDVRGAIRRKTVYPGNYVRLVRETAQGTLLLTSDTRISEVERSGEVRETWAVSGFRHAWKAVRLGNGNTLASAGYGAFLVELDEKGGVVRKFGGKGEVPETMKPNFYATFQVLPNDHVVVANWQGHGPGHGASGMALIEFDPAGAVAWTWNDPARTSSLQGVLILDGLDPDLLHDERNGVMMPAAAVPPPATKKKSR